MIDAADDIEGVALEMIERFGEGAAHVARELAESAAERQRATAQTWRDIADAIERTLAGSAAPREKAENAA